MTLPASDKIDLMFRAFSDRTRLRILNLLQSPSSEAKTKADSSKPDNNAEICVCDLMRVLDLPQAKVSRHLAYLRKAGLVQGRKIHRWMYYRLLPAKGKFHAQLLQCLTICPDELKTLKQDRKQLGQRDCKNLDQYC